MDIWAVIPVKALPLTKSRLTAVLTPTERANLTQRLLQRLLRLLQNVPSVSQVVVVSRDERVWDLARPFGAITIAEDLQAELNGAVATGVRYAKMAGAERILVLPSDLPFLSGAEVTLVGDTAVAHTSALIICPDRHEQGTNALFLSADLDFQFQFGLGSFQKHQQEATRLSQQPHIIRSPGWQFDLDTAEDWEIYASAVISKQ